MDDPGYPRQNEWRERDAPGHEKKRGGKSGGEMSDCRKEINNVRPHEELGMKRPKNIYKKSRWIWEGAEVERKFVCRYYASIKETAENRSEIWFNDFLMGGLDESTGRISSLNAA
ncbi:MAG: hypothetical protein LBG43_10015 [Treponema sp.]|jgi:hypothetical protein|nr:hypothetical protein [Treponema sp.]